MAICYRVERIPLPKPSSCRLRFVPQATGGCDEAAGSFANKAISI
jgi:hypothetical protein